MSTLILQLFNAVSMLSLGILALAVVRGAHRAPGSREAGWWIVGLAFVIAGSNAVVQTSLAVWAFASGPGSAVYETYVRWAPASNTARASVMLGLGIILLLFREYSWSGRRYVLFYLVLMLVAGGALFGMTKIGFSSQYYSFVAGISTVEMLIFLAVLLRTLVAQSVDRLLWIMLAIYAMREAWNVIWLSALAWKYIPGNGWHPNPAYIKFYVAVTYIMMIAVVVQRIRLNRRGAYVGALLEPKAAPKYSVLG
jgi:hypothetical protein